MTIIPAALSTSSGTSYWCASRGRATSSSRCRSATDARGGASTPCSSRRRASPGLRLGRGGRVAGRRAAAGLAHAVGIVSSAISRLVAEWRGAFDIQGVRALSRADDRVDGTPHRVHGRGPSAREIQCACSEMPFSE